MARAATVLPTILWLLLSAGGSAAQVVRGRLVGEEGGLPLEGALVVLEGPSGDVASVLSDAAGRFLLHVPSAGVYTLRADRIGHASTRSDTLRLSAGDTLEVRLAAAVAPVRLEGLEVSGERRCSLRPEAGRAVSTVWEEARKALAAAAFTEASGVYAYRTRRYVRELDERGRRVQSEQSSVDRSFRRAPFESLPPDTLVDRGFVQEDPEGDLYFAPDAAVLLSDAFLATHCLGLVEGSGESNGLLGLAFEPVGGRDLADIRGVVWLDPSTAELRRVDFTYDGLDPALRSDALGGRVTFRGLPDGRWIVAEWRIRMPTASLVADYRGGRRLALTGIREVAGEVDRIRDQAGNTVLAAERATLTGAVFDETGATPLEGAVVSLVGTDATAVTEADGFFRLPDLAGGVYAVTFSHARVPSAFGPPEPVEVTLTTGQVSRVRLVAPSAADLLDAACGGGTWPEGSGALAGTVRDDDTGQAVPGAVVRVTWTGFRLLDRDVLGARDSGTRAEADDEGRYVACGIPPDRLLRVEAEAGPRISAALEARLPVDAPLLGQDLVVTSSGTGSLVGITVAMEDQEALDGVRVRLDGAGVEALSDADGAFAFQDVPQGRYVLRAEMLGRRALADTVRIRPGPALRLEVRLPPEALEVEGLTVEVFSRAELEVRTDPYTGVLDRLTPVQLDALRDRTADIVDAIRLMGSPRIRITETSPQGFPLGFCIRWTRRLPSLRQQQGGSGCPAMLLVVDGQAIGGGPQGLGSALEASGLVLDMDPEDIESVRILSPIQAQFRYGLDGGNGALVVETRRGVREGGGG